MYTLELLQLMIHIEINVNVTSLFCVCTSEMVFYISADFLLVHLIIIVIFNRLDSLVLKLII